MKKSINNLIISITSISIMGTCCHLKLCYDKSKKYNNQVVKYINNFDSDDFLIAAHRGKTSFNIENTSSAIVDAKNSKNIDYIEFDVRMTNDNKLVLSHEDILYTNNDSLTISKTNFSDISNSTFTYNAFNWKNFSYLCDNKMSFIVDSRFKNLDGNNYRIISLDEALGLCGNKKILLDLKFNDNKETFTKLLGDKFKGFNMDNIIFQSLDLESLRYFKQHCRNFNTLALIKSVDDLDYINYFDGVGLKYNLVTRNVIKKISDDKLLAIWTINSPSLLSEVADVLDDNYDDAIYITDYPDIISYELNKYSKKKKKTTF